MCVTQSTVAALERKLNPGISHLDDNKWLQPGESGRVDAGEWGTGPGPVMPTERDRGRSPTLDLSCSFDISLKWLQRQQWTAIIINSLSQSQSASCLIYARALLEYVVFIMWLRSVSKMLPSVKFAEDKVLTFLILHEKCQNSATPSLPKS